MSIVEKQKRHFLPNDFVLEDWAKIEPFFNELLERRLKNVTELRKWLRDLSELEAFLEEAGAWRYIRMTINTADENACAAYKAFITEIQPRVAPLSNQLNRKLVESPYAKELSGDAYRVYLRSIRNDIRLYREKNVTLQTKLQHLAQTYSGITGAMEVTYNGQTLTMQEASKMLSYTDRNLREQIYATTSALREQHIDQIEAVFDEMITLRNEVASNADYADYRSYMFSALGRFDYRIDDCIDFHKSIEVVIMPAALEISKKRLQALQLDQLKPWDLAVDPAGRAPLKPFEQVEDLLDGSICVFDKIDPFFGDCLRSMRDQGHLDLGSKKGKAPGGYNYPLYESGMPFIFMNAVGTQRDLVTMMHEGGHAVHSFLSHPLELTAFKGCPSEVAELASMSMELISMDHWAVFYADEQECTRAKREHLEDILTTLPWIARIDAFQHWLYTNPSHSRADRVSAWLKLDERFGNELIDWSGYEKSRSYSWQRQLHLFEVPFYYIEYAIAQLGAIAVWKNYKENGAKALEQFKNALALGYSRPIGEIYNAAGVEFDFSIGYLRKLISFLQSELEALS